MIEHEHARAPRADRGERRRMRFGATAAGHLGRSGESSTAGVGGRGCGRKNARPHVSPRAWTCEGCHNPEVFRRPPLRPDGEPPAAHDAAERSVVHELPHGGGRAYEKVFRDMAGGPPRPRLAPLRAQNRGASAPSIGGAARLQALAATRGHNFEHGRARRKGIHKRRLIPMRSSTRRHQQMNEARRGPRAPPRLPLAVGPAIRPPRFRGHAPPANAGDREAERQPSPGRRAVTPMDRNLNPPAKLEVRVVPSPAAERAPGEVVEVRRPRRLRGPWPPWRRRPR
jgi:hypothetical protein